MRLCCTGIVLTLLVIGATAESDAKNDSGFVATKEWQVVKKGQSIPKGLHVRHNFETGITEAKIMGEETESEALSNLNIAKKETSKSLILHAEKSVKDDEIKPSETLNISLEELKHKLKDYKSQKNPEETKKKKQAESSKKLNIDGNIKSKNLIDGLTVLLNSYFERFDKHKDSLARTDLNAANILNNLASLELMVHHIDIAQLFADMGGLSKIISPCLNSTNDEIKEKSLIVLGAAVQSNPKVQLAALENDILQKLLLEITNAKPKLQSRCFFALGALVRQFPEAQKALVNHGGFEIFGKILEASYQPSVQTRVMKLVSDLIIERYDTASIANEETKQQRRQEYAATEFEDQLLAHHYCRRLADFFIRIVERVTQEDSDLSIVYEDLFETTFEGMLTASTICEQEFVKRSGDILSTVDAMIMVYEKSDRMQIEAENDDESSTVDWRDNVSRQCTHLLRRLKESIKIDNHDEL